MSYLQHHKRRRTFFIGIFFIAVIISILVFRPTMPRFLTEWAHMLGVPVWQAKNTLVAQAGGILSLLSSKRSLLEENVLLQEEVDRLRLQLLASSALEDEVKRLADVATQRSEEGSVLAAVLVKPNVAPYDTLIIDRGRDDGLIKGDRVLVEGAIIVGVVTEVYTRSAHVTLFSSPGIESAVVIGPSHIQSVARGRGGGNFEAVLPRGVAIEKGDEILMPGISPLLFGVVEEVIAKPSDSFQTILFKNPVNASEIYYVELIPQ